MGGGYIQLSATGAQDVYLVGNPQITFFKAVYRHHTNFSMDWVQQTIYGTPNFGQSFDAIVSKSGDLLSGAYLEIDLPDFTAGGSIISTNHTYTSVATPGVALASISVSYANWCNGVGYAIIKEVDVTIGDQLIDRQTGEWMCIENQLKNNVGAHETAYFHTIGYGSNDNGLYNDAGDRFRTYVGSNNLMVDQTKNMTGIPSTNDTGTGQTDKTQVQVPLNFWFCNNLGLAVPIISLPHTNITFNFTLREFHELYVTNKKKVTAPSSGLGVDNVKLWCQYIYLDNMERMKFSEGKHEYLIEQVQSTTKGISITDTGLIDFPLYFNHPIKTLYWVNHMAEYIKAATGASNPINYPAYWSTSTIGPGKNDWFNFTNVPTTPTRPHGTHAFDTAQIIVNNEARTAMHSAMFYSKTEPQMRYKNVPFSNYVYMYSFSSNPSEFQPSGSFNFSRLDNAAIRMNIAKTTSTYERQINIYAKNYNVLRINSGNSGLAFLS